MKRSLLDAVKHRRSCIAQNEAETFALGLKLETKLEGLLAASEEVRRIQREIQSLKRARTAHEEDLKLLMSSREFRKKRRKRVNAKS